MSERVVAVRDSRHRLKLAHALKNHREVVITEIVCVQVEVIRYLAELREGKVKRLAQAIIKLVALKDHLFIVNAKKERKSDDHVLFTL